MRYGVRIDSPASDIDGLREAVEATCPLYNLLKEPLPIDGRIERARYAPQS